MSKILIVEDNERISNLIKIHLELQSYDVKEASTGKLALDLCDDPYDLLILDLNLPDMSGYDLIETFVNKGVPIIVLTAKDQLEDKVRGFQLGVDDYLTKPFESVELIMRVKAIIKRTKELSRVIKLNNIEIDFNKRIILMNEEEIEVTSKEFDLLAYFIRNKGIALSRDQILNDVWGYDYFGQSRTIDMHVQRIRSKLNVNIRTVYKYGYRME